MCVHVCGEGVRVCIEAKGTAEKTFLVLKLLPVFSHISSHLSCAKGLYQHLGCAARWMENSQTRGSRQSLDPAPTAF